MTTTARRRTTVLVALLLALAALVAVIARGDPAPPVTPEGLAASLSDKVSALGDTGEGECTQRDATRWECLVPDGGGSGAAYYEVTADSESCWKARLTSLQGERSPTTASGCL